MTHPSCLQIVNGISSTPTVLLDLDDQEFWSVNAETTFPPPPLRRSVTSTLLADGETISASAYGNRELRLVLKLHSENADTDATQVQKLVRELDKVTNTMRYTPPGASTPLFFRTSRAAPETVIWDKLERKCYATVPAEPFGYGLRVDVGSTTVTQDPAAGANGCFLDITSVKGDVETPLLLTYGGASNWAGGSTWSFAGVAVSVRPGSSPYPALFRQAEALTLGTDTTVVGSDATFSGSSKARVSFATDASLQVRLTGKLPTATLPAGAENRGRYRVWARVKSTSGQITSGFKLRQAFTSGTDTTYTVQPYAQNIELGIIDVHTAEPTAPGFDASSYGLADISDVELQVSRTVGTGSLDIDYLLLLPADYRYSVCSGGSGTASTDLVVIDCPNDHVYVSATAPFTTPRLSLNVAVGRTGGLPMVRPGDNRVYVFQTAPADGSGVGTRITDTLSVTAYYWPRYVYAKPVAT